MYTPNSLDQTLTQAIIPYNQAYAEMILAYVTPACLVFNTYAPIEKGGGGSQVGNKTGIFKTIPITKDPHSPYIHMEDPLTH